MSTTQMTTEIGTLAPADLAELAKTLMDSVDRGAAEIDEAWQREIIRRADEMDSGKVQGIPHEDVIRDAREALRALRCE